jgi:hypothetical protein
MTLTNQINDELEQKAWVTNPRGSTDAKSENFQGDINRVKRLKKEDVDHDLLLPVDDLQVLKADDDENDRGLLVKLLEDGSYEVAYWYDDLDVYPIEIVVDGESVKKDAKKVTFKFHPELDKSLTKEGGGDGGGGAATSGSFGDGGGTVFTSTNSGIFTPTHGGNGRRKPKKRKRTGINRLADFVTNNSPERKMVKGTNPVTSLSTWAIEQLNKAKTPKGFTQQTSGETINNQPPRIEWQDQSIADDNTNEEKNPTEFKGHPDKGAADRQKNEERRIRSLDDSSDKQDSEPTYTGSANIARPAGLNIRLAWGSGPEVDELSRGGDLDEKQGDIKDPNDPHKASKYIEELRRKLNPAPYVEEDDKNE